MSVSSRSDAVATVDPSSGSRAASSDDTPHPSATPGGRLPRWLANRRWELLVCMAFAALCFGQQPGRLVSDTKLDLAVNPLGFLGQALHLWEPRSDFGHIQNQAAGYFFPMGPFFALGKALGIPMWAVQRLWMAAILAVAFWGTIRVCEALGIGSRNTRLVGAAAYALSPAMTALLGSQSGGQVPMALLPWILLPLITGARRGSVRRAAARSALAVAAMGAVNATSSLCVLVLPALWLLTRRRGPRRRALTAWWALAVVLACTWWAVPLFLQGRYGLNFVPYTESASVTTATTSAAEVVRGTGHWLSYLFVNGPWLRGAWVLVSNPVAVLATTVLAAAGLYGVARRDIAERTFLVVATVVGIVAIAAAWGGSLGGPLAAPLRSLLDGPLSALRNLSKLEPVIRLPLALGLAHALAKLTLRHGERMVAALVAFAVVAAGALPFLLGEGVSDGSFQAIPAYWSSTARWLGDHAPHDRALILPAEAFGEYRWGRPLDEPLQPLAKSPWAVRNLVPLGSVGLTRLLDGAQARLDSASPSPGLAQVLARSGVRYLVVRNDLDPLRRTSPSPAQVRRGLGAAPGLRLVASFGPPLAGRLNTDRLAPSTTAAQQVQALDIYEVPASVDRVTTYPIEGALSLTGGPESLLQLADRADLTHTAVVLDGGGAAEDGRQVAVSDALRRRDVTFGSVRGNASYALTPSESAPGSTRTPNDRQAPGDAPAVMRMSGAVKVEASSYDSTLSPNPERQPWAAFDGDPSTAWVAGSPSGSVGQWVEVTFPSPVDVRDVDVQLLLDNAWRPYADAVLIATDQGQVKRALRPVEQPQQVTVPAGPTRRLRVTIASATGGLRGAGAGFREIAVPGVVIDRAAVLPLPGQGSSPPVILLDRLRADPFDAVRTDEEARLRRVVTLPGTARLPITGVATGRPGPELDALLAAGRPAGGVSVQSSSTWADLPAFAPANAMDGDDATAWVARPDDQRPWIELSWPGARRLDTVSVTGAGGPTRTPTRLLLTSPSGRREVEVPGTGSVSFEPLTTDRVTVTVTRSVAGPGLRLGTGLTPGAVGIGGLRFAALDDLRAAPVQTDQPVDVPCGSGPVVLVDGRPVQTEVSGRLADLAALAPMSLTACGPAPSLGTGEHRVETVDAGPFAVDSLTLGATAPAPATTERSVRVGRWDAADRSVAVGPGAATYLATTENFNNGWQARLGDRVLRPVRLDGWRQGWILPAGAGGVVRLSFQPDRAYRLALGGGLVGVLALVALAFIPGRRRRPEPPPTTSATMSSAAVVVMAAGAAFLLSGVFGLVVVAALLFNPVSRAALAGATFVLAGVFVAIQAGDLSASVGGPFGSVAQALTVVAVAALALALIERKSSPTPS